MDDVFYYATGGDCVSGSSPPPPAAPPVPHGTELACIDRAVPEIFSFVLCFLVIASLVNFAFVSPSDDEEEEERRAKKVVTGGLDPAVLASFPVVTCPEARGAGEGMVGRECAVCLTEFGVGDALRVLPPCRHGFHPVCIDPWLAGHATCPLCRSDLAAGHVIVNGVEA
ncbi:RING-H2 finger protein ATL39-like [Musa acuminata AAA Group]|uniref:RING-H2 finger protein ATL39-like n=1 Tax=Musa acuminata AAA Group TaxID=214697 RepID=UPI0031D38901